MLQFVTSASLLFFFFLCVLTCLETFAIRIMIFMLGWGSCSHVSFMCLFDPFYECYFSYYIICKMVSTVAWWLAHSKKVLSKTPPSGQTFLFWSSPCVSVGSLSVFCLPPTVQRHVINFCPCSSCGVFPVWSGHIYRNSGEPVTGSAVGNVHGEQ